MFGVSSRVTITDSHIYCVFVGTALCLSALPVDSRCASKFSQFKCAQVLTEPSIYLMKPETRKKRAKSSVIEKPVVKVDFNFFQPNENNREKDNLRPVAKQTAPDEC